MTWEDKGTHWAQRGTGGRPPTAKTIQYADIAHKEIQMRLATGVWDDNLYTPLFRNELAWHIRNGGRATFNP